MINLEDIKKNEIITIGAIVSTIYSFGYISHIIKQHLLGINFQLSEINILTNGADFLLSTFIDSIKFTILEPILKFQSFFDSNFILSTILIIIYFVLFFLNKNNNNKLRKIQIYVLILASLNILFFQVRLLKIDNILQSTSFNYIEDVRSNNYTGYSKKELADEHFKRYVFNDKSPLFKKYFSPTEESIKKRLNHYSTIFIFIIMLLLITFKNLKTKRVLFLFILLNIIFMPTTYAIIGNNIYYQNCRVNTKENNSHLGILLANSSDNLIIYSKYNNFKITYIPNQTISSFIVTNKQHLFSSEFNIRNFIISKHEIIDGKTYIELKLKGFIFFVDKYKINATNVSPNLIGDKNMETLEINNLQVNDNILTFYLDSEVKKIRISIVDINDNEKIFPKISTAIKNNLTPIKNDNKK